MKMQHSLSSCVTLFILLLSVTTVSGCVVSVPGDGKRSSHVIIGFGVVRVARPENEPVIATDTAALGLSISDRPGLKMGLGYSSSTVVTVADGAEDVRLEVSKRPWKPLTVETQRVKMFGKLLGTGPGTPEISSAGHRSLPPAIHEQEETP